MLIFIVLLICGVVADHRLDASGTYSRADGFSFPGSAGYNRYRSQNEPSALSKSIALAKQIDMLDSVDQFLQMIDGVPKYEMDSFLSGRFGDVERSGNAIKPIPARCEPELRPVSFTADEYDNSLIYFPTCTRVARCGGCCSHPLTSCQPEVTELVNFEVTVSKIGFDQQISWRNKKIIPLEVHKNCSCTCTIKAKHCTPSQIYIPDECRCACPNFDEESKCKDNDIKQWNSNTCSCSCRYVDPCNTGYDFDQNTCSCQENIKNRWFDVDENNHRTRHASTDGTKIVSANVPPDADDSRRRHKDEPH